MRLEEQALESKEALSYLRRLDLQLADVPRSIAAPLRAQISAQLDAAVRESSSEAELRSAIDRLGEPGEIVAEAPDSGQLPAGPTSRQTLVAASQT